MTHIYFFFYNYDNINRILFPPPLNENKSMYRIKETYRYMFVGLNHKKLKPSIPMLLMGVGWKTTIFVEEESHVITTTNVPVLTFDPELIFFIFWAYSRLDHVHNQYVLWFNKMCR